MRITMFRILAQTYGLALLMGQTTSALSGEWEVLLNVVMIVSKMRWSSKRRCALKAFLRTVVVENLTVMDCSQVTFVGKLFEGGNVVYAGTLQVTPQCSSFSNPAPVCMAVKKFKRFMQGMISSGQIPPGLWAPSCVHVCKPLGVFFAMNSDCMVMSKYSSDLRSVIDSRMKLSHTESAHPVDRPFTELVAVHIMMQLALGLKGLHDCGVYHRDIKAANILVNENWNKNLEFCEVAIADFEGAADTVGAGTQYWRAPEVLLSKKTRVPLVGQHWQAADVYSFGMTCYEILTGKRPLDGLMMSDYGKVVEDNLRPELPDHVPKSLKDIISRCWHHDPASRPSLEDVLLCLGKVDNHRLANAGLAGIPKSFMKLESDRGTLPESPRPTLSHILSAPIDSERQTNFSFWASEYVSTQEQFVSQFDMKAHLISNAHDSLTFAEFVERRRSLAFIRLQRDGSGHNIEATKDEYSRSGPIRFPEILEFAISGRYSVIPDLAPRDYKPRKTHRTRSSSVVRNPLRGGSLTFKTVALCNQ